MIADRDVLARLEWARVQGLLAAGVRTPMGREQSLELVPRDGADVAIRAQARTEQMRQVHQRKGRLPVTAVEHPGPVLLQLAVEGKTLTGVDIYETVRLLVVASETARFLRGLDPLTFPDLAGDWARLPDLEGVIGVIEGNVTPTGHVEDGASGELTHIRREIRHLSERLTRTLEALLKADWTGPVLRDKYVTVRNNRYVVPVRTDTPRRFPGIVHGVSASEQTLFIEPMETVEINNELVRLKEEEDQEVERILAGYTELLRSAREEIATTARVVGELDLLEAAAAWAESVRAVRPDLVEGGGILLRQARHPLLEQSLAALQPPRYMVPIDVDLPRELRGLVISGPNAGGKTVALKTVGLLALMAHAGLPVPAQEARFPLFARVFADIGDEQSISESLSTFASHVKNIAGMMREAAPPSLALIDEIGTGTDPAEGAALGMAVLDRLLAAGLHVVATTHHAAIKAWAYRTPGALNAACDFDEATLRPTYRLVPGVAGASIGLTMAEQLGLAREVVDDARRRLDPAGAEAAAALDAVRTLAVELEQQRADLIGERRQLERAAADREARLRQEEQRRREQWTQRFDELTRAFRVEADRMISRLNDIRDRRALDRQRAAQERELKERFAEEVRATRHTEPAPAGWSPAPGGKVVVASLAKEGTLRALRGDKAEVRLGQAVFTVPLTDLRPPGGATAGPPPADDAHEHRRRVEVPEGVTARVSDRVVPPELNLVGQRVDEALAALDKYLDDASMAGLREARIIHGFGTGALKKAVREHLAGHLEVASWHEAEPEKGGGGVTVAVLAGS